MKKALLILIGLILIVASILFFTTKSDVNDIINSTVSQSQDEKDDLKVEQEEGIIEDQNEIKTNKPSAPEPVSEQIKDLISNTVKQTVNFFQQDIHITAIGDSLTKGVGDQTKQGGYIGILDKTINHSNDVVAFSNFGKTGNRSDQLLERLKKPEIIDSIEDSDIVLVTIGSNDVTLVAKKNITDLVYSKFTEERKEFDLRLHKIIDTINDINDNVHIYILGFYNPFKKYFPDIPELNMIISDWNQTGKEATAKYENTTFIPIKDLFDSSEEELFADDNFHPNFRGYNLMAERVLEYLTDEER